MALSLKLPPVIHPVVCILVAAVVCGLIGAIPALMRYKLGASEMVASLLLNYACSWACSLSAIFFRDPDAGSVVSAKLPDSAKLAELIRRSNIHAGFLWLFF